MAHNNIDSQYIPDFEQLSNYTKTLWLEHSNNHKKKKK